MRLDLHWMMVFFMVALVELVTVVGLANAPFHLPILVVMAALPGVFAQGIILTRATDIWKMEGRKAGLGFLLQNEAAIAVGCSVVALLYWLLARPQVP